jgi:spore maturation protein CgeB
MKLVIFGLAVSSSWGNGHAVLWRGLIGALIAAGHRVTFFERNTRFYAATRDLVELPDGGKLVFYDEWSRCSPEARRELSDADVGMVTSYCPDGVAACEAVLASPASRTCFYDLDTPVTLACLQRGEPIDYIDPDQLARFDIVLSYTGGAAVETLTKLLGARRAVPIYGGVDPTAYRPAPRPQDRAALSYLGTFARDRQPALERLFIGPARRRSTERFVIGGAQYPIDFPWTENIYFLRHLPPADHPAFYASARLTLNVTRQAMARMGWCPSGRLFEAAACGTAILTDWWDGLDRFFEPGSEILVARSTDEVLDAIDLAPEALDRVAIRARDRVLAEHTAGHRAADMIAALEAA